MSSSVIKGTIPFILSILTILLVAISAPAVVEAMLGPSAASSGDVQQGNSIMASGDKVPDANPAAQIGTLADTGVFSSVGVGITSPVSPLHIYSTTSTQPETIDLDGPSPITAQWNNYSNSGGAFSGSGFLARFARGTKAAPANVLNGDRLGFNVFGGWVGGAFKHTGAIEVIVDSGTISDTSLPTYMRFLTTPDGSTTRSERMRITGGGNVGIGTTNPISGRLDVETDNSSIAAMYGQNNGSGIGVYGQNITGGAGAGVQGSSSTGVGVRGISTGSDGVYGQSSSGSSVHGYNTGSTNHGYLADSQYGVYGSSASGTGVYGYSSSGKGVKGQSTDDYALYGISENATGIYGKNNRYGNYGVLGTVDWGAYGKNIASNNQGYLGTADYGVYGISDNGTGAYGRSTNLNGVLGMSTNGTGVYGLSTNWYGLYGLSQKGSAGVVGVYGSESSTTWGQLGGPNYAVRGYTDNTSYYAAWFDGKVHVNGTLTKNSGSFIIDHPQDPANKYLEHSFVESPEMMNIYRGNVLLNDSGEATVQMPSYFEALNRDFAYQLTAIGAPSPNLYVAEEINGNHFKIAGGKPGLKISWQVTGVRQDVYAKAHPIVVEQEKPASERGLYLNPMEWGQPKERGISTALNK